MTGTKIVVVDGHAYAYRAYHAIAGLRAPDGAPVNAIFGFIKALEKIEERVRPDLGVVVWDGGLAVERTVLLPEYKAQRPAMPEELRVQFDGINDYLDAAGWAWFRQDGVEADDWIASVTRWATGRGAQVIIASPDKDFMQLVSSEVGLLNPGDKTGTIWGQKQVADKTGVSPGQIVDWLSLIGDSVDNIRGVPGIGPKTATDLLCHYGTIEGLLAGLEHVQSERLRTVLRSSEAILKRNRELIRLQDTLPVTGELEQMRRRPGDRQRQQELFQRWGFRSLAAQAGALFVQPELL